MTATPSFVQVPADSGGKKLAAAQITDEATNQVLRQEMVIADPETPASRLRVFAEDTAHASGDTGLLVLGVRNDANTSPVSADGDYHALQFNSQGRLKVSVQPADLAIVVGAINTVNGQLACDVSRAGSIMAFLASGTFTGANVSFEGSLDSTDGANGTWFSIQALRSNANTIEAVTGVLAAAPAYAWKIGTNGMNWVRARATAITTGAMNWQLAPSSTAIEPIPGIGAHAISGTTTAAFTNSGTLIATATGAKTKAKVKTAATTNLTSVKATAGRIFNINLTNNTAADKWIKFYNKASAPVVASDVPVATYLIPAKGNLNIVDLIGDSFATGIAYAITGGVAETDATATAVDDVTGQILYL